MKRFFLSRNLITFLSLSLSLCLSLSLFSQSCQDASVELSAVVQVNPPQITLNWIANPGATSHFLYRKLKNSSNWGSVVASLPGSATQYIDTTARAGVNYEYRVIRQAGTYTGYGYINAGMEIPLVESRGTMILVVDNSMSEPLVQELKQLTQDMEGDGWHVERIDVDRAGSPVSVKAMIKSIYDDHPSKTKAVFLVGRVPVPYSGELNPDGHPDHIGAWPTDLYYADMSSSWTDNAVNNITAGDPRNQNIPGDGKFDQSMIPSDVELQVGRVDFANMPAFAISETELLRNYLKKDHAYRQRLFKPVSRGVIDDNFGFFGAEAFASSGFKNLAPLVGPENVVSNDYFTTLADSSYLWSYGCGGGWYQGAGGIGSTSDFAVSHTQSVFTMLFGSYFGDWDSQDNFLRAPLAQGLTLTNAWSGRPHWMFHHMGLGETIGYCARLTQNNNATYFASYGARLVSIGLMGDPSLRNQMFAPVSNLVVQQGGTGAVLSWDRSADSIRGYNVYRKIDAEDEFELVNALPISETNYTDSCLVRDGRYIYMVRSFGLQHSPSGTYYDMGEGVLDTVELKGFPEVIAEAGYETNLDEVTFTNLSLNGETFTWNFGDGETSTEKDPVHLFENDGQYTVTLVAFNACSADTFSFQLDIATGIKPVNANKIVQIFPNPTNAYIKLSCQDEQLELTNLKIFDINGIIVASMPAFKCGQTIDVTAMAVGIYMMVFEANGISYYQLLSRQ